MACKTPEKFFKVVTSPALPAGTFKGALALVTGGGSGLGKAIATMFAQLGADVAIAARRTDVLAVTASEIRAKTGADCEGFRMDVKDPAVVSKSIDEITKRFGKLPSIVVNNAAGNFIMATERTIISITALTKCSEGCGGHRIDRDTERHDGGVQESDEEQPGLHRAQYYDSICQELKKAAQRAKETAYFRHGGAFVVPSAVSKAGVENMTRSLATEWAKYGMRFNVIAPGPIPTEVRFTLIS
ncbi:oxidoreductase, short chain dehydrogenase/reductase family protein [Ancylostoma caninum]|uniref:Oxidoreductase, short chain dehydrogenase/reductase family protein n=1 Tax=Ancylostoma caninum TaxID=29170 RepID=A0A368FBF4_ANCCA|nr:oxidoreductase, short chain dehydrogenase/reductase family protein [Ancylostoma caninum]